ncbi:heparan-alpha-glucosaminide N-acetyltransferase-like isoform X2 [Saccostrea echinata]|uniref:heparan-alpha-glucosaminide N-acetyltransferase-like isoform X2 n=1 Tax=Saccostrea echinata TaxID=191078 RepID=UPI002A7F3B9B|nr:heparan-alpha-glucosaminide N-acetyltransferase-like isoform X2 [Saccostrea echinata]
MTMAVLSRKRRCILHVLCVNILCQISPSLAVTRDLPIQCVTAEDKMNNARLNILYTSGSVPPNDLYSIVLYYQTEECFKCPLMKKVVISNNSTCNILIDSRWKARIEIRPNNTDVVKQDKSCLEAKLSRKLHEYGEYDLYVAFSPSSTGKETQNGSIKCKDPVLTNMPDDSYIPIYVAIGCFAGVAIIIAIGKFLYKKRWYCLNRLFLTTGNESLINPGAYTSEDLGVMQTTINPADEQDNRPKKERLKSLDTFRGISIIVMIFVNYGGGGYWFFRHSRWNGLTFADLVFPWFIWIMGTAMVYSFTGLLRRVTPKHKIFWKIFKRSCILFVLGLLINTGGCEATALTKLRIPGVLQRFAGTYFVVASIHMFFAKTVDVSMYTYWGFIRDIVDYWLEWIFYLVFVTAHIVITFVLDVPGCPKGYVGPGGLHENGQHMNCTGGAAGYIDRKVFGEGHIYQSPTCKEIYKTTVPYDPEGLLGTLNSIFLCFLGLQAGKILMTYKEPAARVKRFIIWGVILCIIAGALCEFKKDGGAIPINKNLWSLSFVLCMAGFAFFLLAFCYLTIDVYKVWSGAPFYFPGMNSIFMYIAHTTYQNFFPVGWKVDENHWQLLALHLWGPAFFCLFTYMMHCKKIYIAI